MIFGAVIEAGSGVFPQESASGGFPTLPDRPVERQHVIETISRVPTEEYPVVFIEGEDGCGATTLLAQFCLGVSTPAFHLFVRPHSRFAYSVPYLRFMLATQFCAYLGRELPPDSSVDESEYHALLLAIRKKNGRGILYIIVDGLHQVPRDDRRQLKEIFGDVLSFGVDGFRYLITGRQEIFQEYLPGVGSKTCPVQQLSRDEATHFFDGLGIEESDADELIRLCKGLPGRLASVRRQIEAGAAVESILAADAKNYPQFLAMEFRPLDELSSLEKTIVAVIAFSRYAPSAEELLKLCDANQTHIANITQRCSFVAIRSEPPFSTFESETHRRIAETRLESLRSTALALQISHLSDNPNSLKTLQFLPSYLQQANQHSTLIEMLSPEHYERLLDSTQSVSILRARAAIGARSAHELKLAVETFQFSLQRSIFADVATARGCQAQVAALVGLGQPQKALDVASRAATKERRLQMLAEYARTMRESGAQLDKEVVATIRELASEVDYFGSPTEAEELAENLAFVDPDLAISVLDCSNVSNDHKYQRDEALAKVSVAASLSGAQDNGAIFEKTASQISDERLRTLIAFIAGYLGDVSAIQISAIADPMKVERRIYFLRSILGAADGRKGSLDIVEYALDQLISATSYLPKIRDFVDFATPLGFEGVDLTRAEKLLRRMEEQIALVAEASTSGDRVRLEMKLARVDSLIDETAAQKRLVECYFQISAISSTETKVECLAVLLHALKDVDRSGAIEKKEHLSEVVSNDLLQSIAELLLLTASHFEVVRSTLAALTKFDIRAAVGIAERLNTQSARDAAYDHIVHIAFSGTKPADGSQEILCVVDRISNPKLRDDCIVTAIDSARRSSVASQWFETLLALVRKSTTAHGICSAITALFRSECSELPAHTDELVVRMRAGLAAIPSPVDLVSALFRFSAALSRTNRGLAVEFYEAAETARSTSRIVTGASEATMAKVMALLVRTARPLLRFDELNDDYLARVVRLFNLLPDPLARVAHLCDLASKAWCEHRLEISRRIVQQHCRPLLEEFDKDSEIYKSLAILVFPALFLARGTQAFELLESQDRDARDHALHTCCQIIIRRVTRADPWPGDNSACVIALDDAEDVVRLISQMQSDISIFGAVKGFTESLLNKRSKEKISIQQRLGIRQKLDEVVRARLPDIHNIKHDGYLIACRAHLGRLSTNPADFWTDLRQSAESMENVADKVLVLLEVALCLPPKSSVQKRAMFEIAKSATEEIPSAYDRYGRLNYLVECARDTEPAMARGALRDALKITFELDSEAAAVKSRRKLLDVAEQIDPKLVDTLIDAIDDDPARAEAKAQLVSQSKVQKARRRIADARSEVEKDDKGEDVLPSAAWKTVGSLVAGRVEPQIAERLLEYVEASGEWDLHSAFPVLSWYIENSGRRVMRSEDVVSKVTPIWEALVLSAELAINVISKDSSRQKIRIFEEAVNRTGILVGRREGREGALEFLRMWLREHAECAEPLLLCDPYFGLGDMEFVRLVLGESPDQRLVILTSKKSLGSAGADDFSKAWSDMVDQDPPDVEIIAMSDPGDERSPVHDRWLLGATSGIRLGTSMGGFGGRLSEISAIESSALSELLVRLQPFVERQRTIEGKKINYVAFSL
ncbi:MAG TPA: hypothetical protein VFN25_07550 [Dokdonella sp.]|uniref:hypothetical protein n=1 Tax=Dokdonella sp. TaxID=2291710 RepID=UPI002D8100CD|nr:hypothetical protein [Dokdonella sp.]HET9032743.1 hypothetical protein [Dokdonella sp.]